MKHHNKNKQTLSQEFDSDFLSIQLETASDDHRPIYLSGNFNNWAAQDDAYKLLKIRSGKYFFEFPRHIELPSPLEYLFTRGGWENLELDKNGNKAPKRVLETPKGSVKDFVPLWLKDGKRYTKNYLPVIQVISEQFAIPELVKTRRIAALLPYDYYSTDKRYPVLYLQDGQNLFDDYAPFGNWAVDKKLALLAEKGIGDFIVIAIDHAKEERIAEFTPSQQTKLGVGDGKKYARFLAETLKTYIDKHFRTRPERQYTGIGGSSMGGLISIYAGLLYPNVFGKLMIFSPSLWVTPKLNYSAFDFSKTEQTDIYVYAGGQEGESMIPKIIQFKEMLEQKRSEGATINLKISIDPTGKHNETRWGKEFPQATEWLFFK